MKCKEKECDRECIAKGYCSRHYQSFRYRMDRRLYNRQTREWREKNPWKNQDMFKIAYAEHREELKARRRERELRQRKEIFEQKMKEIWGTYEPKAIYSGEQGLSEGVVHTEGKLIWRWRSSTYSKILCVYGMGEKRDRKVTLTDDGKTKVRDPFKSYRIQAIKVFYNHEKWYTASTEKWAWKVFNMFKKLRWRQMR